MHTVTYIFVYNTAEGKNMVGSPLIWHKTDLGVVSYFYG